MELITLASSSRGNCHILCGEHENIMLDCGIKISNNLSTILAYDIKHILVTHSHKDHCLGLTEKKNLLVNVSVYSNEKTLETLNIYDYQKNIVKPLEIFKIGDEFAVIPVFVPHDADCYAYYIRQQTTGETLLYLTDTGMAKQLTFEGVTHFLVECNYDERWYDDIESDDDRYFKYRRLISGKGHISIQQCIDFLKSNINVGTKSITLCHISHSYKDYESFGVRVSSEINNDNIKFKALNNHIKKKEIVKTIL